MHRNKNKLVNFKGEQAVKTYKLRLCSEIEFVLIKLS